MKLMWFRRDLRVVDNTALTQALASAEPVCALYLATPEQWHQHHLAARQADLLFRSLQTLAASLAEIQIPLVYREVGTYHDCVDVIQQVVQQCDINEVFCNQEYEYHEQQRDRRVERQLNQWQVKFTACHDKCVMAPGSILNKQGDYYRVFTPFKRAWLAQLSAPVVRSVTAQSEVVLPPSLAGDVFSDQASFRYPRQSSAAWPVEFDAIRQRLRGFCQQEVARYHQQRDFPAKSGTSQLSPYLAVGSLSARQCLARLYANAMVRGLNDGESTWLSELIWREFYQHLLWFRADLSKGKSFHQWGERLNWHSDPARFACWCQGMTGYPLVDAAMRQLNQTGWMHNRLRMVVASFLIKDLHIDWRWGEQYFMSQLIDGDYAANNGGWQWCASTGCDGQPYFRIFNPISQSQKFDPQGQFIRQWLPELAAVPDACLHEPWKWPAADTLAYPRPVVEHKAERTLTLAWYKQARDESA